MYVFGDFPIPENPNIVTVDGFREGDPPLTFVKVPIAKTEDGRVYDMYNIPRPPGAGGLEYSGDNITALVKLPKGVNKIVKPEDCPPYTSFHPRLISLGSCENDENATSIGFHAALELTLDFEKLATKSYIQSMPIPLYHAHVFWCYGVTIKQGEDGLYSFAFFSTRDLAHRDDDDSVRGPRQENLPTGLNAPDTKRFTMGITGADGEPLDINRIHQLTKQELLDLSVDGKLQIHLRIIIDCAYFSLDSIIDLEKKPTVSDAKEDIVAAILRGGKPAGWDLKITGVARDSGSSISSAYYVHKAAFVGVSEEFEAALTPGKSAWGIELVNGGRAVRVVHLNDELMHIAIKIAYGVPIPLPAAQSVSRFSRKILYQLFDVHIKNTIVPQWQREICRDVVALDKRDVPASINHLLPLLHLIWEAPMGWFPMAERVAIGVFADIVHLNARTSVDLFLREFVMTRMRELGIRNVHQIEIVETMLLLLRGTQRVRKTAFVEDSDATKDGGDEESEAKNDGDVGDSEADDDVSDEEVSSSSSSHEHDEEDGNNEKEEEKVDERDEWYDVEAGDTGNQNRSCSIS